MHKITGAALVAAFAASCATTPDGTPVTVRTAGLLAPTVAVGDTGTVKRGDEIVAGRLSPMAFVTLTSAMTTATDGVYEPGKLLFRSALGPNASFTDEAKAVWCETDRAAQIAIGRRRCFEDTDRDGAFDQEIVLIGTFPWSLYGRHSGRVREEPVTGGAYEAGEGPPPGYAVHTLSYELCTTQGTPRFRSRVLADGERGTAVSCDFGEAGDDGLIVDTLTLDTQVADDRLTYAVTKAPEAGLAFVRDTGAALAMVDADGTAPTMAQTSIAALGKVLSNPTLVSTRDGALPTDVTVAEDEPFAVLPARYGTMGRLVEPVTFKDSLYRSMLSFGAKTELAAGTPVYGVLFGDVVSLLGSPEGVRTTWCALAPKEADGRTGSLCMVPSSVGGAYHLVLRDTLLATQVSYQPGGGRDAYPVVEEAASGLPNLELSLMVTKVKRDTVTVGFQLSNPAGDLQMADERVLKRAPDGSAFLVLGGGDDAARITLRPLPDGRIAVTTVGALGVGTPLL